MCKHYSSPHISRHARGNRADQAAPTPEICRFQSHRGTQGRRRDSREGLEKLKETSNLNSRRLEYFLASIPVHLCIGPLLDGRCLSPKPTWVQASFVPRGAAWVEVPAHGWHTYPRGQDMRQRAFTPAKKMNRNKI